MNRKSLSLMTGVALTALMTGAPSAFAQVPIVQGVTGTPITNSGAVTGTAADSVNTSGAISGLLSGASIGSTGVVASVGVLSNNTAFGSGSNLDLPSGGITSIGQVTSNSGAITRPAATITVGTAGASSISGVGASASISSTGSVASVGIQNIETADLWQIQIQQDHPR